MRKHHFLTIALLCIGIVTVKSQCTLGVSIPSVNNVNCLGGASGSATANITHHITTNFSYESAVQNFVVPAGVTSVVVSVAGGSGGNEPNTGLSGGSGASFSGTCNVIPGDVLSVVVGGKGTDAPVPVYEAAGGGGGTFIYDSNQVALLGPAAAATAGYLYLVAGGGGGTAYAGNSGNGSNGGIDLSGNSTTPGDGSSFAGGTNGLGGAAGAYGGGGGGGFLGNGADGSAYSNISYGGNDCINGFAQTGGFYYNNGGYGGGGGGGDAGGGGGGGYNGGGGGGDAGSGGGGGSYLFGFPASLVSAPVANNTGNGSVSITYMFAGNTSPYTYLWAPNGGTNVTATGLTIGTYTVTITDANSCTASDSAIIIQLPAVTVSISQVNTTCNGVANAIATSNVYNGNLPFTYSWSNGEGTNSRANNLSAGTYSVNVTDALGCSASASVSITQPVLLDAQIFAKMSCNGGTGSATISATQTVTTTFSYTGTIQNLVIPPNALGTATISIAGAMGGSWNFSIGGAGATFSGLCTIIPEDTMSIVVGGAGGINYNYSCGGGGGSFIWDANTNILLAAAAGGGGGADGFNGGWGGIDLSGNGTTVGLGYNNAAGGNGGVGGSGDPTYGSGGGGAGWLSNGGNAFGNSPGLGGMDKANGFAGGGSPDGAPGGYGGGGGGGWGGGGGGGYNGGGGGNDPEYYYSGGGGGSYLNGSVIGAPIANNTGNGSATVTYIAWTGRPPYTYSWSNGDTSSSVTGLSPGTYTATVTDANGCSTSESVIIIQPAPLTSSVSVSANVSCYGGYDGSAGVNVNGGISPYTYSWSGTIERTGSTASGLMAGTYIVSIIDSNGCSAVANITITQPALLRDTISSINNVPCNGGSGSLTAGIAVGGTSPYTYSWSSGLGSNRTFTGLSAGTYVLTVTDVHGCNAVLSATITQPAVLTLSTSQTNISTYGAANGSATVNSSGGTSPYTYLWSDGETSSATNPVLVPGIYTILVKDANQCSASASLTITQPTPLGIPTTSVANAICNGGTGTVEVLFNQTSRTFSFDSAVQNFTVPSGVTILNVAISGGAGNNNVWYGGNYGLGASFSGICNVIPGDVLSVVVGQQTPKATNAFAGGGGGASWLYDSSQVATLGINAINPLAIAGGGGGEGAVYFGFGGNGGANLSTSAATNGGYGNGAGGIGGNGGQAGVPGQYGGGGGGAGWLSNGVVGIGGFDGGVAFPGNNYVLPGHFAGGNQFPGEINNTPSGNFGGYGGGGAGSEYGGGGGGGYNGGGGGNDYYYNYDYNGGGGGGSFLDGYISSAVVANNSGNGQVTLSYSNLGGTPPYTYSWSPSGGTNAVAEVTAGSYTVTVTDNAGYVAIAYVSVSQPALPLSISIASVSNVVCSGGTGSITANAATGGVPPYNYSWSPSGGTNLSASLAAGTYTLYATDNLGCTATATATITQPAPLGITIASLSNVSCNGGSGSVTVNQATGATPPYTYSWSPAGGTGLTATGLSAGTYTLTVTDKFGCGIMTQATITQPAFILSASVISVTNPVCHGGTGSASIGLDYPVTTAFSFEPAVQNLVIPQGAFSTATLTVAGASGGYDGGCSGDVGGNGATFTGICTLIPGHVLSVAVGQAGGTSMYCQGGGGGGGTFVYDSNTIAPVVIAGGGGGGSEWDYTYDGNYQNGAPGGDTVTSPYSPVGLSWSAGYLITGAGGAGGGGGAMGYDSSGYEGIGSGGAGWLGNGGNDTGSYPSGGGLDRTNGFLGGFPEPGDANNGGYGGGGAGGLVGGGGGDIMYYGQYNGDGGGGGSYLNGALSGSATANNSGNGYATITYLNYGAPILSTGGTAPYTYSWSPSGGSNINARGLTAGTYTVTITDNHGCSAIVFVTITQPNALSISASVSANVNCNGANTGSCGVNASGGNIPYTYLWSNGAAINSISGLSAGVYGVTVLDSCGASGTASVTITSPGAINISASATAVMCNGTSTGKANASVSGGTSPYIYSWSPTGGNSSTASGLSAGTYTIHVTSNSGCTASASVIITQPTLMTATASATAEETCNGGSTGKATASVSGGTSPYTRPLA